MRFYERYLYDYRDERADDVYDEIYYNRLPKADITMMNIQYTNELSDKKKNLDTLKQTLAGFGKSTSEWRQALTRKQLRRAARYIEQDIYNLERDIEHLTECIKSMKYYHNYD
jgi:hypothetical protein